MYLEAEGPIQEAHVVWAGLCPLDSDGDGATNGEELGDPDCNWVRGQADPAGNVTNPGNGSSGHGVARPGLLTGATGIATVETSHTQYQEGAYDSSRSAGPFRGVTPISTAM